MPSTRSRRTFLRTVSVVGLTSLAGCSTLRRIEDNFVKYRLDGIFTDNAVDEPIEFKLEILDGSDPIYETTVSLSGLDSNDGESSTVVEEPWMENKARYGIRVTPPDEDQITLTLADILGYHTESIHAKPYIEYTVTYTGFYRISVNFYDEPRT